MLYLNVLPEFDLRLFLFRHSRIEYLHFSVTSLQKHTGGDEDLQISWHLTCGDRTTTKTFHLPVYIVDVGCSPGGVNTYIIVYQLSQTSSKWLVKPTTVRSCERNFCLLQHVQRDRLHFGTSGSSRLRLCRSGRERHHKQCMGLG